MVEGDLRRRPSNLLRIMAAVDKLGAVPGHMIAKYSGLTPKQVHAGVSGLVSRGRLSRTEKPKGGGYYKFFLNDDQREAYYRLLGEVPRSGLADVGSISAAERLRFLRGLNDRSVYAGNPVLVAIIEDYERTLKAGVGVD